MINIALSLRRVKPATATATATATFTSITSRISRLRVNTSSLCLVRDFSTSNMASTLKQTVTASEAENDVTKAFSDVKKAQKAQKAALAIKSFEKLRRSVGREGVVYFDHQATTAVDPRVFEKMVPFFSVAYGNPHSRTHAFGWESEKAVEDARREIARLVCASDPKEIIFTSGATEANNLALKGVARFYRTAGRSPRSHIITATTEHKCVLDSCRALENEGFSITYLPVQPCTGLVAVDDIRAAIRADTVLVSIMAVNNEIGVIQPIAEIGALCKSRGVFFHTDAAQALGKIELDVEKMSIDLMSLSAHKIYGPKGIGALFVRRRPRVRLEPLFSGGGQERGLRSGTVPTPLVVGFGEACKIANQQMKSDYEKISLLSKRLIDGITSQLTHVALNGDSVKRFPGCVNLSFACVEGESLLMALKDFALSSGSACTSASLEPSYVLRALRGHSSQPVLNDQSGKQDNNPATIDINTDAEDDAMAHSSIRFGIGRFTTENEIDLVIKRVVESVNKLREMSPLWEMVQEGINLNSISWSH